MSMNQTYMHKNNKYEFRKGYDKMAGKNKGTNKTNENEVNKMPVTAHNRDGTNKKWERVLSERGQTVVPKDIRDYLDIKGGDSLQWSVNDDGEVVIKPKKRKSVMDLKGILKPKEPIEDIDEAIREAKKEIAERKHREGRL